VGALALSFIGIQTLTNAPAAPAYTPGTVDLPIYVVPDLQGSRWDVRLPNMLTVHVGDTVHLTILNSIETEHGFKLDAFGIDNPLPAATSDAGGNITPSQTTVTFTLDQVGSFEFKCNVPCGPGHDFMVGTLVVLPD
jgi:heme/copper-type cytochrome/quinol oxidase subunit 2